VAPITLTLPVRTDKVWVNNPTLVLGVLDNEAAAALTTTHCGLKVVMMNPPTLTVVVGTQDGLDLVPGLIINQGYHGILAWLSRVADSGVSRRRAWLVSTLVHSRWTCY
jgi:hypothetical protein